MKDRLNFGGWTLIAAMLVMSISTLLAACGGGNESPSFAPNTTTSVPQAPVATAAPAFVQMEQLARPAVNEGLFLHNDYLNAYNASTPTQVLSLLGDPTNPVTAEALGTLTALGNSQTRIGELATALFPDVMRIDTTIASPVGTGAYANGARVISAADNVVQPRAGRKIEDDVIDITLIVLTNNPAASDGVSYNSNASNTVPASNPAQGHHLLSGQTAPNGAATFPFLAPPN
jgi:hypothetical protein